MPLSERADVARLIVHRNARPVPGFFVNRFNEKTLEFRLFCRGLHGRNLGEVLAVEADWVWLSWQGNKVRYEKNGCRGCAEYGG